MSRGQPTEHDLKLWNPTISKVREARQLLEEAYYLSGEAFTSLNRGDKEGLQAYHILSLQIAYARSALMGVEHPVREDWAGPEAPNALSWRSPIGGDA